MNTFFLIDKPIGISSFDVIRQMRKTLNIKKIGHTGTLDPLATGCLLLATGNYTKLIPFFEADTKEYEFTLRFDGVTESLDLGTDVIHCDIDVFHQAQKTLTEAKIRDLLDCYFLGEIEQIPPKYSALKIGGKKAVDLVREGKTVEMKKRKITIFEIQILDFSFPELTLRAKVSAGTYIRTIASDLGERVGTGAYVTKLRRTKIGNLDIKNAITIEEVSQDVSCEIETLFSKERFLCLPQDIIDKLNHGMRIKYKGLTKGYYFLGDTMNITNVVFYDGYVLHPKKKIL